MEIKNNVTAIRTAIKKAKTVYITSPLTEEYIKVSKTTMMNDIGLWVEDTELSDNLYIRFGSNENDKTSLYIN